MRRPVPEFAGTGGGAYGLRPDQMPSEIERERTGDPVGVEALRPLVGPHRVDAGAVEAAVRTVERVAEGDELALEAPGGPPGRAPPHGPADLARDRRRLLPDPERGEHELAGPTVGGDADAGLVPAERVGGRRRRTSGQAPTTGSPAGSAVARGSGPAGRVVPQSTGREAVQATVSDGPDQIPSRRSVHGPAMRSVIMNPRLRSYASMATAPLMSKRRVRAVDVVAELDQPLLDAAGADARGWSAARPARRARRRRCDGPGPDAELGQRRRPGDAGDEDPDALLELAHGGDGGRVERPIGAADGVARVGSSARSRQTTPGPVLAAAQRPLDACSARRLRGRGRRHRRWRSAADASAVAGAVGARRRLRLRGRPAPWSRSSSARRGRRSAAVVVVGGRRGGRGRRWSWSSPSSCVVVVVDSPAPSSPGEACADRLGTSVAASKQRDDRRAGPRW